MPLGIAQPAADGKHPAMVITHPQRTGMAAVFALAGQVGDNRGLGVVPGFDLQQQWAAPGVMTGMPMVGHQPLAAVFEHLLQPVLQGCVVGNRQLPDQGEVWLRGSGEQPLQGLMAVGEITRHAGQVEGMEAYCLPAAILRVGTTYQCADRIKPAPP